MRKRVITPSPQSHELREEAWLDLESLAQVEITSEDPEHPVEGALLPGKGSGWRAAGPGEQSIRLQFDLPQEVRRIRLEFVEPDVERTQEFVLRWSAGAAEPRQEILRQQWNFSPRGATHQIEDLRVDLAGVVVLELSIIPDISGGQARASLAELRLA